MTRKRKTEQRKKRKKLKDLKELDKARQLKKTEMESQVGGIGVQEKGSSTQPN